MMTAQVQPCTCCLHSSPVGSLQFSLRLQTQVPVDPKKVCAGGDNEVQRTMLEIVNQLDGFDSRGNIKVCLQHMIGACWLTGWVADLQVCWAAGADGHQQARHA